MYRIRFHGRGGQGMKTAGRLLGSAFFLEGWEVQDAPRYGAERRGAPLFSYVRADRQPILERGIIPRPDLVIVADDSLIANPAAGVVEGLDGHTVLLIASRDEAATWRQRLNTAATVVVLPAGEEVADRAELRYIGATCAGAAARLLGVIGRAALGQAIRGELAGLGAAVVDRNLERALAAYEAMAPWEGTVQPVAPQPVSAWQAPEWIDLPLETAAVAAPVIQDAANSGEVRTGLWRTLRPELERAQCKRCWWICSTFCPDGAIAVTAEGYPQIDYDHCKGCLVCVAQCPSHALLAVPEHATAEEAP